MGFRPVTVWMVQCDGELPHGLCRERYHCYDEQGQRIRVLLDDPHLSVTEIRCLNAAGWMHLPDGRFLCPGHVAAAEYIMRTAIDGLPLEDESS